MATEHSAPDHFQARFDLEGLAERALAKAGRFPAAVGRSRPCSGAPGNYFASSGLEPAPPPEIAPSTLFSLEAEAPVPCRLVIPD